MAVINAIGNASSASPSTDQTSALVHPGDLEKYGFAKQKVGYSDIAPTAHNLGFGDKIAAQLENDIRENKWMDRKGGAGPLHINPDVFKDLASKAGVKWDPQTANDLGKAGLEYAVRVCGKLYQQTDPRQYGRSTVGYLVNYPPGP